MRRFVLAAALMAGALNAQEFTPLPNGYGWFCAKPSCVPVFPIIMPLITMQAKDWMLTDPNIIGYGSAESMSRYLQPQRKPDEVRWDKRGTDSWSLIRNHKIVATVMPLDRYFGVYDTAFHIQGEWDDIEIAKAEAERLFLKTENGDE